MIKQFLTFDGDKTEKKEFCYSKNPIAIDYVDINEIIISDVFAYGRNKKTDAKFFIWYRDKKN